MYVCLCVYVCVWWKVMHIPAHIHICVYVCVCVMYVRVCVCVYVKGDNT